MDTALSSRVLTNEGIREPPKVGAGYGRTEDFRFSETRSRNEFSPVYGYDGFRESRQERSHAHRLRLGLHRRAVARPPARRTEEGGVQAGLHRQGVGRAGGPAGPG